MKKHLKQLVLKTSMKVVLNVKEPLHTTNQIIISNRILRGFTKGSNLERYIRYVILLSYLRLNNMLILVNFIRIS